MKTLKYFQFGLIFFLFLFFSNKETVAQSIKVSGYVTDMTTREPMIFTNVVVEKTSIGTTTDENGFYELILNSKPDSLTCSSIGYTTLKKAVNSNSTQVINFEMESMQNELQEIVILPGPDHADIMMKKVIAAKKDNDPKRFDSYSYESYNKLEIDMDDLSSKLRDNKLLKPFQFIFDNMDSTSEEKPFLPIFLTESISDYYYRNNPRKTREIIKGTKISGIKNESVNQFLGTMYQNINVYDNWLPILDKSFVSPLSDQGMFYYKYYLVDTAVVQGDTLFKLYFKPKRKQENTFQGDMWIVNTSWSLQQVSMIIDQSANINFVKKVAVFQNYEKINSFGWVLNKDKLIAVFAATKENSPGLIGRKTTSYKNIKINPQNIDSHLKGSDDIIVLEGSDEHDEAYWQNSRHDSLSKNEKSIYAMVDSLKDMPMFKTWVDYITIFTTGYKILGPIEIGPYFNIYSNNFVEGHRFRVGFRTSNKFSTKYEFGAFAAYGTKDNRFKYGSHLIWVINKQPRRDITMKYFYDLDVSNPNEQEFGQDNILSGLYRRNIPQKLTFQNNFLISYLHELKFGYSNKISFVRKDISPYFDFSYYDGERLPDLIINKDLIQTAEIKFNTHFAYKEKFVSSNIYRTSLGSKYPALDVEFTLGIKGILGSNYNYQKINVSVNDWFNIPPLGWSSYYISAGRTFGKLPFLLLNILQGNETYFYNSGAFNLMNNYEFITDRYAMIVWNHHFEGLILNKIPLLRKLKLRWLVSGKAVIGNMSNENKLVNSAPINFIKINTPYTKPYAEASVGLENILKIFRVDAIWRLTYLDYPDAAPFGVRLGMQLYF